jgi:membrane-associated phospholipid phosphatase
LAVVLLSCSVGLCAQRVQESVPPSASSIVPPGASTGETGGNYDLPPGADPQNNIGVPLLRHIGEDQKNFWTFPTRLRRQDLKWVIPAVAGTAGLFAADSWISKQVPNRPDQVSRSRTISDYSVYSLIAAGGGAYVFGKLSNNDHMRETGFLAAEAAVNATAVTYAFKLATARERPYTGTGEGEFFAGHHSSNLSFPSEHSAIAWSIAGVIAHEYPGPLAKLGAYGLASAVTLTRVTARQHFTSDVIVGSVLGWYFAHQVYRAHHDPELGGEAWGSYFEPNSEPRQRLPQNMSSPYVPPDSYIYPLFDRLAALGVVTTAYEGIRPWTRMECARLLEEASERIHSEDGAPGDAEQIYRSLSREFEPETGRLNGAANLGVSLDSLYARATQISGAPLTDGYHFAQTLVNDYGRPYSEGFNSISGFSAHAVAGPLSFALQGEYQHSPGVSSYSPSVQQAIAVADATSAFPAGRPGIDRFDVVSGTVALQFHNLQLSAGKQTEWWSVSSGAPLLLGNNAEPFLAIKIDNVSPYHFPLLSKFLGDARSEYFLGRLDGHDFEFNVDHLIGPGGVQPQPFLQGFKISFKPTQNLEFGGGFTAMFGGPGLPFTLHNFLRTLYSHTSNTATNPGKRTAEFDFSYRIPGLRKWLTLYRDSLAVDEYSPLTSSRPSLNMGLYMPMLPKLRKMDFRAEIIGTPHTREFAPGFVYWDFRRYRDGYTNDRNLLASWMGRAGRGGEGWFTYWFSPRSTLQFGYRYQKVDRDFLEGGHLDDVSVRPTIMLAHDLSLSGMFQVEHWYFPLLSTSGQTNATAQLQLTLFPHLRVRK